MGSSVRGKMFELVESMAFHLLYLFFFLDRTSNVEFVESKIDIGDLVNHLSRFV